MNFKELFKVRPVDQEENGYMITFGKHLATEEVFKTRKAAEMQINKINWDMVACVAGAMAEALVRQVEPKKESEVTNG